jgi:hypothetical protein
MESAKGEIANPNVRYVLGRNVHANTTEQLYDGTNAVFLSLLAGNSDPSTPPEIGVAVHVDDVALLHVLALDQSKINKTKPVQNFFLSKGKSNPLMVVLAGRGKAANGHRHRLERCDQDRC